jgi:hypothetical protein
MRDARLFAISGGGRKAEAHAALRASEIDALEHEREIDGVDLHDAAAVLHEVGEGEAAPGETLRIDAVSRAIPEENAHLIGATIEEAEEMA